MSIWDKFKAELPETKKEFIYQTLETRGSLKIEIKRKFGEPVEGLPRINYRDAEVDISISNKDGESFSLNTYLPPGYKMIEVQSARLDLGASELLTSEGGKVEFSRYALFLPDSSASAESLVQRNYKRTYDLHEFLKVKGAFVTLLHEVGHGWDRLYRSEREEDMTNAARRLFNAKVALGKEAVPDDFVEDYNDYVLQEERAAWTYALRVLRELRKEGFDLEEGMSNQDLRQFVNRPLESYHQNDPRIKSLRRERLQRRKNSDS